MFDSNDEGTIWDNIDGKSEMTEMEKEYCQDETPNKGICIIMLAVMFGIVIISSLVWFLNDSYHYVPIDSYVIAQKQDGTLEVWDKYGDHFSPFTMTWTYPRNTTVKTEMLVATFNDTRQRAFDTMTRLSLPTDDEARLKFHMVMGAKPQDIKNMVRSVVMDSLKSTAPIMNTTELRGHRHAEFAHMVGDQLIKGLFLQQRVEKEVNGKLFYGSEVVKNDKGNPIIAKKPVFADYGLTVSHFSITATHIPEHELIEQRRKDEALKARILKGAIPIDPNVEVTDYEYPEEVKVRFNDGGTTPNSSLSHVALNPLIKQAPEVQKK